MVVGPFARSWVQVEARRGQVMKTSALEQVLALRAGFGPAPVSVEDFLDTAMEAPSFRFGGPDSRGVAGAASARP